MWSPASTSTASLDAWPMTLRFWRTASAVPRYHSATRPRAMYGWSIRIPPELRSRSHGRPMPMWSLRERGLYWVRTTTLSMSEFTQLESAKSMIRYLPPKGTAGLARIDERMESRSPSPPASITARVRFIGRPRGPSPAVDRVPSMLSPPGPLDEEARVHEHAVDSDGPGEG